jgi:hypothetical protein
MTAIRKFGIPAPDSISSPVTPVELSISSVPGCPGSLSYADLFPESDLSNVGNTRPPQHLRHFVGNDIERTYLTYFAAGDLHAYRHGKKVRVEGSTTHPAQLELLRDLFGGYAKPIYEPALAPRGHYGLRATFDLDSSFDFLLNKPRELARRVLGDDALFYTALSGFSDAEGHAGLKRSHGKAYARYTLSNRNRRIMRGFQRGLISRGYSAPLYALRAEKIQWQLEVNGNHAQRLLPNIALRHREKLVSRQLAITYNRSSWAIAGPVYSAHRGAILAERSALEALAARRYNLRGDRRRRKEKIFSDRVASTFELFSVGLGVEEVAGALKCSIRTAYRRKEKFREWKRKR